MDRKFVNCGKTLSLGFVSVLRSFLNKTLTGEARTALLCSKNKRANKKYTNEIYKQIFHS